MTSATVATILRALVENLLTSKSSSSDAATQRAYAEAARVVEVVRAQYAPESQSDPPTGLAALPDRTQVDIDPHAVASALWTIYQGIFSEFRRMRSAGDSVAQDAYGEAMLAVQSEGHGWAKYAEVVRPTPPPPPPDAAELRVMGEAVRLARQLGVPPDLDADDDSVHDRKRRRWQDDCQEAGHELAFFADHDNSLLNRCYVHLGREHGQGREAGTVGQVATAIANYASGFRAPGNRGLEVTGTAEIFANWILQAERREDRDRVDQLTIEVAAKLMAYTQTELAAGLEALPLGWVRSDDPVRAQQLAARLVVSALERW